MDIGEGAIFCLGGPTYSRQNFKLYKLQLYKLYRIAQISLIFTCQSVS